MKKNFSVDFDGHPNPQSTMLVKMLGCWLLHIYKCFYKMCDNDVVQVNTQTKGVNYDFRIL
ncbi:hypothetical protein DERF_014215 [Dermatophagoides farinae]|uniref:Uncharacterized protein n=1 Tax=Dermatophagoides farinae TaxID=6954 RepID=A0A922HNM6_DERFA|nr:hypothetical protein DERF_014215 [Dermatophagoides farinae]